MNLDGAKEKYYAALRQLRGDIRARLDWQKQKAERLKAEIERGQKAQEQRPASIIARRFRQFRDFIFRRRR